MVGLKLDVVRFANEDVIATSAGLLTGKYASFFIPSAQYNNGALGGDYVQFNGTFGEYSAGNYNITNVHGAAVDSENERADLSSGGSVVVHGVTIPASPEMETFAKQYYDAFSYGDGLYYTNGVSYYDQYWQ